MQTTTPANVARIGGETCFITGGTGFIGRFLVEKLLGIQTTKLTFLQLHYLSYQFYTY